MYFNLIDQKVLPMRSLKKHLRFYLLLLLIPSLIFISAVDYQRTNNNIENEFNQQEMNQEKMITDSVELIDNRNEILSDTFARAMKTESKKFLDAYNRSKGNITEMNLNSIKQKMDWGIRVDRADLYVINRTGVVVNTTYSEDMGLDFKEYPEFYEKLDNIFIEGEFKSDFIAQETQTGKFRIYSYIPTPDQEYILEIGLYSSKFDQMLGEKSYLKTADQLKEMNPYLKNIRFFNTNGDRVSDSSYNTSKRVKKICSDVYENKTDQTFLDEEKNEKIKYILVYLPHEEYPSDSSIIVQLTFDERMRSDRLKENALTHLLIGSLSVTIAIVGVLFLSRHFTKPIKDMVEDIDNIAEGDFAERIELEGDTKIEELNVLKNSSNNMLQKLNNYISKLRDTQEREEFLRSLFRQDINNKLFVSLGYLELVDKDSLSSEDEEHLRKAIESNIKVLDLVELEKEAKRAREKRFTSKKELEDIFRDALEGCRNFSDQKDIEITSRIRNPVGKVLGGRSLEKIISALIKATIRRENCEKIKVIGKRKGKMVLVQIEDDGEPLPDVLKEKIMEGKYTGESSGQGGPIYFIAKEILEIYSGRFEIKESDMGGTRIDIYLREA